MTRSIDLVSCDPGKATVYVAAWASRTLVQVERIKAPSGNELRTALLKYKGARLAIEKPIFNQRATGKRARVRPVDIIDLAVRVGWVEAAPWRGVTEYLPEQWKGQVEKKAHNRHDLRRLTNSELTVVETCGIPPSLLNNAIDALGVGLYYLERRDMIRPATCPRVLTLVP